MKRWKNGCVAALLAISLCCSSVGPVMATDGAAKSESATPTKDEGKSGSVAKDVVAGAVGVGAAAGIATAAGSGAAAPVITAALATIGGSMALGLGVVAGAGALVGYGGYKLAGWIWDKVAGE